MSDENGIPEVVVGPGVYGDVEDQGAILDGHEGSVLSILTTATYDIGAAVVAGADVAVELFFRGADSTTWSRPWQADPLRPLDITGDAVDRFVDVRFRADGVLFALCTQAGELSLSRTRGIFNPLTPLHYDNWYTDSKAVFPVQFYDSEVLSEVSSDASTRIPPKLRFGPEGVAWLVTALGIVRIPDPLGSPEIWSLWIGIEDVDLGSTPVAGVLPAGLHIVDLAFDGRIPGVLVRINPDEGVTDDGMLYLFGEDFRSVAWERRYPNPARGIRSTNSQYPRSSVIHLGRTPSPLPGEGPDPETLGDGA